jgi:hypothetical protein
MPRDIRADSEVFTTNHAKGRESEGAKGFPGPAKFKPSGEDLPEQAASALPRNLRGLRVPR